MSWSVISPQEAIAATDERVYSQNYQRASNNNQQRGLWNRLLLLYGLQPHFLVLLDSNQLEQFITACLPIHHGLDMHYYVPGPEVPAMSLDCVTALEDGNGRFNHLKVNNHAFQCYLGLWRTININTPEDISTSYCQR